MKCPECGKTVNTVRTVHGTLEAFTALDPLEGLSAYGPYDLPKELKCSRKLGNVAVHHIKFPNGEQRLVRHIIER